MRAVLETSERFVAQVERWGGDVLPGMLEEGSAGTDGGVGKLVEERFAIVREFDEVRHTLITRLPGAEFRIRKGVPFPPRGVL